MSLKKIAFSVLFAGLVAAPASVLSAQDTRTVNQPAFPTTCTTLAATQSITTAGEPTLETTFDTTRIQAALSGAAAACTGATVELTAGGTNGVFNAFLIAPIYIPTGVTLVVDAGVTVFGSRIPANYQIGTVGTGQEQCGVVGTLGNGCYPLITFGTSSAGSATTGAGIMGYGVINGRGGDTLLSATGTALTNPYPTVCTTGYTWWCVANDANVVTNGAQNNPILIYAKKATNLTLYKISLWNSPMFHMKYTGANGFTVWGIKISTPYSSRNTDGIDIDDAVNNVTVANSYIADGDDNIAIGATAGNPVTDITVNGDYTYSGHGISIGSYTAGGVSNVLVENSNQSGNQNDTNAAGLKIKSAEDRGGVVNNIQYNGICMQNQRYNLQFNPFYDTTTGTSYPQFNNIGLHNVSITSLGVGNDQFNGFNATYPLNITFDNLYSSNSNVSPATEYAAITLGPGPVRPVALQTMTGTDVTYTGAVTKPNEARWACTAANFPFLVGELFLSTPGQVPALTNQQTLTLSNPAAFTLNATLEVTDSGDPAPTAGIQFYEGTTLKGTVSIAASGSGNGTLATLALTGVTSGVHTYTATYPGDTNYPAQTFGSVTVNVGVIPTTTTMTAAPSSTTYGTNVLLTATVAPTTGTVTPTGTVTFYNGTTSLGTGTLNTTTGVATLTVNTLPVGTDSIYATYAGSTQNGGSTSSGTPTLVTIAYANTTTTIKATGSPAIYGSMITLTATVTSATSGTPTDTVTFYDGTTVLGTQTLTGNTAVFITTALTAGSHAALTAVYGGDVNFNGSTSAAASPAVLIFTATTTTSLGVLPGSTEPYGTTITMFASINSGAATTATGNVVFTDGATTIGTVPVSGSSATLTISTLAVGTHSISCTYTGDGNYTGSSCVAAPLTITQAASSSVIAATSTSIVYGASDTFTVTVSPQISGTPTGTVTFKDGTTVISTMTLTAGTNMSTAAFLDTTLVGGSHSISCTYSGDTNFAASSCTALAVAVATAASATGLSVATPITYGGSSLLTATVTSTAAGTPTGSVTFKDGTTTLGSGTVGSGGVATYTAAGLTGGTHSITAVYGGDTNYTTSTSTAASLVVNKATPSDTVSANPTTITFGSSTTLSSTVTGVSGGVTPTGSMSFYYGGTTLIGTGTLTAGVASISTTTLPTGVDSITAVYSGDGNYLTSTSATPASVTVNQATSATVLTASAYTITYGSATLLTAAVTPAAASGTVTFKDGTTVLGPGTLSGGIATFNATALTGGVHSITAVYGGDTNDTASTSTAITVTVNTASTTTTVVPNPATITYGASTLLMATISSTTATGTVTFKDGTTTLGTGTVSGGSATYTATALAGGVHSVTAVYGGDTNYAGSTSAAATVTVNTAATTTTVSPNPATITYGVSTLLTATVSSTAVGTPTGSVIFKDGTTTLGTGTVSAGVATYNATALGGGTHSITAVYSGDTNYSGSTSAAATVTVNKANTTSTVGANPTTLTFGATTVLTGTVSPAAATGTFTFFDGSVSVGTATISGGVATLTGVVLPAGSNSITCTYSGDSNYNTSSCTPPVTVTVNKATLTAVLTTNPTTIVYGASVLLTATLSNAVAGQSPTGTVTYYDGTTVVGTGTLTAGQATYSATGLSGGAHNLSCVYAGDSNYTSATCATVVFTVTTATTTTLLTAAPSTITYGASTQLTATISSPTATGTVTFKDGTTTLGTGTVSGGSATYTATALAGGVHSITAVYGGDTNYGGSTSAAATVTVNTAATTTTVSPNPATITYGASTLLTATVTSTAAGTPTGTVTFKDGVTTLGTGTVSAGQATYMATALGGGTHSITAVYSGDTNYSASTSAVTTVTVNKANTTSTVGANPTTLTYGATTTLTGTVSPATATGTFQFFDGSVSLGTATISAGSATLTGVALGGGVHSITAVYSGDTNYNTSTSVTPVTVTVSQATGTASLSVSPTTAAYGTSVTMLVTVPTAATGTVTLKDGAATLGTVTVSAGKATYVTASLTGGTHNLSCTYSGDSNYTSATCATVVFTITTAATTTGLTANPTTMAYGVSTLLTATVSSTTATGTVTFKDGTTTLGTGTVTNGVATYTAAGLLGGVHSMTAVYSGDTNYAGSTSSAVTVTVTLAATTTALTAAPPTITYGQATLLTATVSSTTATGTITFKDGTTTLGVGTVTAGVATYNATALAGGSHSINCTYSGDTNYAGSSCSAVVVTVNTAAVTATIGANPSTAGFGTSIVLTVTLSNTAATGSVAFKDGSTAIGTGTVSAGVATITVSTFTVGTHTITGVYSGDTNYSATTTATPATVVINLGATTSTVTATPSTLTYGTSTLLTATVSPSTATGSFTFKDGTTTLGTGTISAGVATFTATGLTAGTHSITAVYSGDSNYATSTSATATVTVNQLATTTGLTVVPATTNYGATVTLTATVSNASVTGSVTFKDGTTTIGSPVSVASGIANTTVSTLSVGTHNITAVYSGDTNYIASTSAVVTETVSLAPTTSSITAIPSTAPYGTTTVMTVTVAPSGATGTVTFKDGATVLGTSTLASGVATLPATLTAGTHALGCSYSGDANYAASTCTTPASVVITVATSVVTASAIPSTVAFGLGTNLSASVTPAGATGTITFRDTGTGLSLGSATLSAGSATLPGVLLSPAGVHNITATYSGDTNVGGGTSAAIPVTVTQGATATTIANSPVSPVVYGTSVTLSTTNTVLLGVAPTGTVKYYDGTTLLGPGTISLNASNVPVSSLVLATLMPGVHSLTAVYQGDANYASSTSSVDSFTVTQGNSTTTLVATPAQVTPSQSYALSATVASGSGGSTPTGTVTFYNSSNVSLGTVALVSGVATSAAQSQTVLGSYTYTAVYSGDTDYTTSTSAVTTVVVKQLGSTTTIMAVPTSGTFGGVTYTVTASVSSITGTPTGSVTFKDGTTVLGTQTLGTSNVVSLTGLVLAGGVHTVNAYYSGDPTYTSSDSTAAPATITVNKAATSTGLVAAPTTSSFGTKVTFTATVSNTTTTAATGTVTFMNGTATLGTGTLSGGVATFSSSTLPIAVYSVTAVYGGDTNFLGSTSTASTVTVTQIAQTITVSSLPTSVTYGVGPQLVTATATSGLQVTLAVTGQATLTGGTLMITGAGTVVLTATQSGNATYAAATPVVITITVAKAPLSVVVTNQSMQAGAAVPPLTGTFTGVVNGDAITVSYATTGTSSSPAGTYPITATLADPTNRLSNYTVTNTPGVLTITANAQTITFPTLPANVIYGVSSMTLSATASSGLAVTYTVTGLATITGTTLAITGAGTVVVTANQAGNNIYSAATPISQTIVVAKAPLSVVVDSKSMLAGAAVPPLTGTFAGVVNGDAITVSYSTTGTSTSPAGTYPITATLADPNGRLVNYTLTNTPGVLTITANAQTITFTGIPANVTYGVAPITLTATASSGLAVTYTLTGPATITGTTLAINGAGTVCVTASQAGNNIYSAATPVTLCTNVAKASLSVVVNNLSILVGATIPTLTGTFTGVVNGDNITVTYTTTALNSNTAGTFPITATLVDPNGRLVNYTVTNTPGVLTISVGTQTITFPAIPTNVTYGVGPITLTATASSGLAVTYTLTGPASIAGSILTITGAGTVCVTANQPGNSTYSAATPVTQCINVAKAPLSVIVNSFTRAYSVANPTLTGTLTGVVTGDAITVSYATTATITSDPGTYPITATLADPNNKLANYTVTNTPGTMTVTIATTVVTFTMSTAQAIVGAPVVFTAVVTSPNGAPQTGTVNFVSGATVLGAATISAGSGGVTLSNIAVGTYSVQAVFVASTDFATSSSAAQTLTIVNPVSIGLNPTSISLAAGTSGSSTLTVTPNAGFTGSVAMLCSSPVAYLTCTVTTPIAITGTAAVTGTVTINIAATASLTKPQMGPQRGGTFYALLVPFGALLLLPFVYRRRVARVMVLLLLAVGSSAVLAGCGSGHGSSSAATNLPPAGAESVTISATANGTTVTTVLTVNITN